MSPRYQRGSLRREKRAGGDKWVWRYRLTGVMKQEAYPVADFKTKSVMWKHLEPSIRVLNGQAEKPVHVAPTMGDVMKKYIDQELPKLAASTRNTQGGQLRLHIEPRWGNKPLADIEPGEVEEWVSTIKQVNTGEDMSQTSRSHIVILMRRLFKLTTAISQIPRKAIPDGGSAIKPKNFGVNGINSSNRQVFLGMTFSVNWDTAAPPKFPQGFPTDGRLFPDDVIGGAKERNAPGNSLDVYNYSSTKNAWASTRRAMVTTYIPVNNAGGTCPK